MQPHYVATFSEKPQVLDGHPFVVEAGVSLGGAEVSDPAYGVLQGRHIFACAVSHSVRDTSGSDK